MSVQEKGSTRDTQEAVASCVVSVIDHPLYRPEKTRWFLRTMKGQRAVQVEDYFPDLRCFLDSVKHFMTLDELAGPCLNEREVYRLKKMFVKVRAQLDSADQA